jgi:hypothetical protein
MEVAAKGGRRERALRALRLVIEIAISVAAAVLLAVGGRVDGHLSLVGARPSKSFVLIGVGAVLLAVEAFLVARNRRAFARLREAVPGLQRRAELGEAAPLRLARVELKVLAEGAHYYSNERISLYREEADGFTLIARYSANPRFDQSLGRTALPLANGVIGKAWEGGSHAIGDLPAPGEGEEPVRRWLRAQDRLGIGEEIASVLTMRSQSYAAFRIRTPDDEAEGAIVFESTAAAADFGGSAVHPLLTVAALEEPVKEASPRLAQLLRETRVLERAEIRRLLEAEQASHRGNQVAGRSD